MSKRKNHTRLLYNQQIYLDRNVNRKAGNNTSWEGITTGCWITCDTSNTETVNVLLVNDELNVNLQTQTTKITFNTFAPLHSKFK